VVCRIEPEKNPCVIFQLRSKIKVDPKGFYRQTAQRASKGILPEKAPLRARNL